MSNVWWYTVCIYESGHPYLIFMTTTIKQQLYAIHDNYHQTAATKWVFGLVWVHGASKRRHQQQQIWESVSGSATPPHTHTHTPTHPHTHPPTHPPTQTHTPFFSAPSTLFTWQCHAVQQVESTCCLLSIIHTHKFQSITLLQTNSANEYDRMQHVSRFLLLLVSAWIQIRWSLT